METQSLKARLHQIIFHASWIGFSLFVLANAWVSEDAYITLRVLDNFFNGYGLRWNIHERVQAYTHPLWLLLHIPLGAVISDLFLVDVILSVLCTTGAILVTLYTVRKPTLIMLGVFFLPLMASKAFRDYSSSGLENPLSYLMFATFGYVIIKKYDHPQFWFLCSLTTALALLNRLDMIILYAPSLAWLAWTRLRKIRWGQILLGATPLLLWFVFSLFYYGFLFPNTKYAKLDTGLDMYRYINHGLKYAKFTLVMDTVTALAILSPLTFVFLALRKDPPVLHRLQMFPICIALGICWYILYIINIGGDYMLGRFWAFPAFMSIWLAYVFIPNHFNLKILAAMAVIITIVAAPFPVSKEIRKHCKPCVMTPHPMIDAKYMFSGNLFIPDLYPLKFNTEAHHKFVNWAKNMVKKAPPHVEKAHFIGMLGYYAGPGNILIDELALADPLLARLPVTPKDGFFVGHFKRIIPRGYLYAVKTGSTEKMDPDLAKYYEKLRLITSGELTDPERLKTIVEFNMGKYDHWKRDYLLCNVW